MLSFERVLYEDMKDECNCEELEIMLDANKSLIRQYALEKAISIEDVKKQICLHAPQYEKKIYTARGFLKKHIFPILNNVFASYGESLNTYLALCGADRLGEKSYITWKKESDERKLIIIQDKNTFEAEIRLVDESVGEFIETELHYLRAPRKKSIHRIGLFIKGYLWPICYMNFCPVDRNDKWIALKKSVNTEIDKNSIIELARVFGCGNLPKNTVSLLIGFAAKHLRKQKYLYMITAVNITLGFSGNSMLASQFVPYATRPVNYHYDAKNQYCTKRKGELSHSCKHHMPPNIIYVREIAPSSGRELLYCKLVDIRNNYSYNETAIEHKIYAIRQELEGVWSEKTRYHGTVMDGNNYISKGQCGVSSLLLARLLGKKGYDIRFCEGDAVFPKLRNSIYDHCWVKVINYNKRQENVIIDITADQNGYTQKVLFKTEAELEKLHISYITKSEKRPDEVDVEHLVNRLAYLEQGLANGRSLS